MERKDGLNRPLSVFDRIEEGIPIGTVEIGGKSDQQLMQGLHGINIGTDVQDMLRNLGLPARGPQQLQLGILRVGHDLGLERPTFDQTLAKGKELGYRLVPAETGAHLRAIYGGQSLHELLLMAMAPILDSNGPSRLRAGVPPGGLVVA